MSDGKTRLILEAGVPLRQIREALDFGLSQVSAALITHEHMDHAKAAKELLKAGVEVYCSKGTAEALGLDHHRLHILEAKRHVQIGTWHITPFEAVHDAAEPLCFVLRSGWEKLLFLTDSAYCRYRFSGLTHVAIECNYDLDVLKTNVIAGVIDREVKRRTVRSHMSLQTLKAFFKANDLRQVRQVWLLHLSGDNSDAERFRREIQQLAGKPVECC